MTKEVVIRLPILKIGDVVLEMPLGAQLLTIGTQKSCSTVTLGQENANQNEQLVAVVTANPSEKRKMRRRIRTVRVMRTVKALTETSPSYLGSTQLADKSMVHMYNKGIVDE